MRSGSWYSNGYGVQCAGDPITGGGMENEGVRRLGEMELRIGRMEVEMGTAIVKVQRLNDDMYNHGTDGLKTKVEKFIAREDERWDNIGSAIKALAWSFGVILAALTLAVGFLTYLEANRQLKSGMLGVTPQATERVSAEWRH